ncbi:SRPBCC domain-containing protein [Shewanella cyperi]|uniref:SRPBCC domain-containing protein n=1 Tax=Shewanella cyperi TaxID=2814292 RepID=UPI001A951258|nr:SRPBCC domain-containing protein [Shewanella cyperi]QSX40079.1 SRPBCC domain-containing protein [Shewanella cyperi]
MDISIEQWIAAPLEHVWRAWVNPEDIIHWNFANDDWCCPRAELQLAVGGKFSYRMEAKDGSFGFDFEGEFVAISPREEISFTIADGRMVKVQFQACDGGTRLVETFQAEDQNSAEQQRQGWLCILQNFKKHVESQRD